MTEKEQRLSQTTIVYLMVSFIFSLIVSIFTSEMKYEGEIIKLGFFVRFFMVLCGTPGAFLGLKAGKAIRDYLMPDMFFTTGGVKEIAKTKIFWAIGPQAIGFFIGYGIGAGIPFALSLSV